MNDITNIARTSSSNARTGAAACACMCGDVAHPRFAQPASVCTAG
ncbi:hypothetical protein FHR47_000406 [Xanthomonas arboricola]|nr:hypothetical protein [Xanthomonas cannabis]MBB3800181.1 hypothetical protein [Xanthomonas cannabis]